MGKKTHAALCCWFMVLTGLIVHCTAKGTQRREHLFVFCLRYHRSRAWRDDREGCYKETFGLLAMPQSYVVE